MLCVPVANFVVALDKGHVVAHGSPHQVMKADIFPRVIQEAIELELLQLQQSPKLQDKPSDVWKSCLLSSEETPGFAAQPVNEMLLLIKDSDVEGTNVVEWAAGKLYVAAMGAWPFWVILILLFGAEQIARAASTLCIGKWSNDSISRSSRSNTDVQSILTVHTTLHLTPHSWLAPFDTTVNTLHHILVFAIISLSGIVFVMM